METFLRVAEIAVIPVIVAGVTAGIGAWALIRSHRRDVKDLDSRNTEQHNENAVLLTHLSKQIGGIDTKVDRLDSRLDNVQTWQAEHEKAHLVESRDNIP